MVCGLTRAIGRPAATGATGPGRLDEWSARPPGRAHGSHRQEVLDGASPTLPAASEPRQADACIQSDARTDGSARLERRFPGARRLLAHEGAVSPCERARERSLRGSSRLLIRLSSSRSASAPLRVAAPARWVAPRCTLQYPVGVCLIVSCSLEACSPPTLLEPPSAGCPHPAEPSLNARTPGDRVRWALRSSCSTCGATRHRA